MRWNLLLNFKHKLNGTGQNCTKPILHIGQKIARGGKMHEDNFAPKVNFSGFIILHGVLFLHEMKLIYIHT